MAGQPRDAACGGAAGMSARPATAQEDVAAARLAIRSQAALSVAELRAACDVLERKGDWLDRAQAAELRKVLDAEHGRARPTTGSKMARPTKTAQRIALWAPVAVVLISIGALIWR